MSDVFTFLIRFVHILSGVTWVGGAFLWSMIIAPNVLQRGPAAIRRPFLEATLAKLAPYFIGSGSLTIVSGFWVMGLLVGFPNLATTFQAGSYGTALGTGVVAAIVMLLLGIFVMRPTGGKLLATMQALPPGPPSAEAQAQLGALGKKLGIAGMGTILLGTVALGAMVWAVNVVR